MSSQRRRRQLLNWPTFLLPVIPSIKTFSIYICLPPVAAAAFGIAVASSSHWSGGYVIREVGTHKFVGEIVEVRNSTCAGRSFPERNLRNEFRECK